MFIILLAYFKVKPVVLAPGFHQIKNDLKFVGSDLSSGLGFRPFNLTHKERARIYQRIFKLTDYQRWNNKLHRNKLLAELTTTAYSWNHPRALLDRAIEYLSVLKIAIPSYTTLQELISVVVNNTNDKLVTNAESILSIDLIEMVSGFINNQGILTLHQLRQAAKNFTQAELKKELIVHQHLKPWIYEVNLVLDSLALSRKNQEHFSERIDYYGAKLKRQPPGNQRLYLLCYLQTRWQQALERIAEGFIHHVRQTKLKAQAYAREVVYQDWQKAAKNVSKAAEVLHLFIDSNVDPLFSLPL